MIHSYFRYLFFLLLLNFFLWVLFNCYKILTFDYNVEKLGLFLLFSPRYSLVIYFGTHSPTHKSMLFPHVHSLPIFASDSGRLVFSYYLFCQGTRETFASGILRLPPHVSLGPIPFPAPECRIPLYI
jgi:hypothetical protein